MRERVHIGAFELGQLAIFEDLARDGMVQGLQNVGRSGDGLAFGRTARGHDPHLFEQDAAELLGRRDIEFMPGQRMDFGGEAADLGVHET